MFVNALQLTHAIGPYILEMACQSCQYALSVIFVDGGLIHENLHQEQ